MNLLTDPWLPVVRRSGRREVIRPAQITDGIDDDPIVAPATPRPDFDGAALQFLIGLLQTAFAPRDERAWGAHYDRPPSPDALQAAFATHAAAFELEGDGPRFMQDLTLDPASTGPTEVRQLLIDAPGENTLKNNADLFVRGDAVRQMGRAAAALALFTLQTNAPGGGAGHRTGLRGGGPLTTIVVAGVDGTLWETCWLNVLTAQQFVQSQYGEPSLNRPADVFPWMGETRTSEKGRPDTTAAEVHPAQVYWGMPRRIRLVFEEAGDAPCDIDGAHDTRCVRSYATVPWGVNYTGTWRHPLTPAVMTRKGDRVNLTTKQGGPSWRDWPALVLGGEGSEPAAVITALGAERHRRRRAELRVAAFGYDMDNMKARCWYRADMPFIHVEPEHRARFIAAIRGIVEATDYMDSMLGKLVLQALDNRGTARGSALGDSISGALLRETEAAFFDAARDLRRALEAGEPTEAISRRWHGVLVRAVPRLFDEWVDLDQRIHVAPEAVVKARRELGNHLHGKAMRKHLDLPPPEKKKPRETTTQASPPARKGRR